MLFFTGKNYFIMKAISNISLLITRLRSIIPVSIALLVLSLASQEHLQATPLLGDYTINAGAATGGTNFHSFTDFASSINANGISGNVIVTVVSGSGPYIEQVVINTVQGAGPTATVLLEGNGETISAVTTTLNRHVIRLSNVQYFTINNLHISRDPSSSGGFYGIHIFSTGNYITISNCSVVMSNTTSTLDGAYIASGSETSILVTGNFHNLTLTGNSSEGGGYGASVFGLVTNLASNIVISDNQFINAHSNGVYLRETNGAVISNNFFDKTTAAVTSFNFIQTAQAANINAQIFNNTIQVSQTLNGTMTVRGIYLFNGTGHKVYNNVIHNIQLQSGTFTAIEVRTGATAPEICYNTIAIDNPIAGTGNMYGIKEELSNTNTIIRNNVISISQGTSGTKTALALASNSNLNSAFNSDYNDIWVPGGNVAQKGSPYTTMTYYPTLANWQSVSGQDSHTFNENPVFVSAHYSQPTNGTIDNTGTPVAWISTDITGATRGTPPDPGAYEFSAAPPPAPDTIYGSVMMCENATAQVYYVTPVTGATSYTWTVTGASLVSGQGSSTITVTFSNLATTISVFASNSTGNSAPTSITIGINPLPAVSFLLPVHTVCLNYLSFGLSGGTPANGTYSGPGVQNNAFNPGAAGIGNHILTYSFQDLNGCIGTATDIIAVDPCPGTDEQPGLNCNTIIYPNPFQTSASVLLPRDMGSLTVKIFNSQGKLIRTQIADASGFTLERGSLSGGVYHLLIISQEGKISYAAFQIL